MFSVVCFSQVQCFVLVLKLELRSDFSDLSSSSFHLWGVESPSGTSFLLLVRTLPLLHFYILVSFYLKQTRWHFILFGVLGFLSYSAELRILYLSFLLLERWNKKFSQNNHLYLCWKRMRNINSWLVREAPCFICKFTSS